MTYPPPLQNPPPQRRHHGVRNGLLLGFAIVVFALIAISATVAAIGSGSKPGGHPAATDAAATPAVTTPPVTNPDGKYSGSCGYTLGSDPVGGTARATGDITMHNTGNVGIKVRLKITWPQQGYAPLAMTRIVELATGASRDVPFHRPLSSNELDNLQNWQTGHNYADGCTYKASIISTFGPVS